MPATSSTSDPVIQNANQLYWNSDRTVDQIVDDLEISRHALYSSIRPYSAGIVCAQCGDRMVFANRTSRESRTASCASCGTEAHVTAAARPREEQRDDARTDARSGEPMQGLSRWRDELAAVPRERAVMVGGAAALGVVLGAAAARAVRERI
jgi:hypothetical protein